MKRINDNRHVQLKCEDLELVLGPYTEAASSRSLPIEAIVIKLADKGYSGACRPTFAAAVRSSLNGTFLFAHSFSISVYTIITFNAIERASSFSGEEECLFSQTPGVVYCPDIELMKATLHLPVLS